MTLRTLFVVSSIVATGTKIIIAVKDQKKMDQLEKLLKERNRNTFQRVLTDMEHTRSVVDKVLAGDYGTDFGRAIRDVRSDREFERIVDHFND